MARLVLGIKCETCGRRAPVMVLEEFQHAGRLSGDALRRVRDFTSRHGGGAPERQHEQLERQRKERVRAERLRAARHGRGSPGPVLAAAELLQELGAGERAPTRPCVVKPCTFTSPERTPISGVCHRDVGDDRICGRPEPCEAHPDEQATGEEQAA
jgi:hypothetical protein